MAHPILGHLPQFGSKCFVTVCVYLASHRKWWGESNISVGLHNYFYFKTFQFPSGKFQIKWQRQCSFCHLDGHFHTMTVESMFIVHLKSISSTLIRSFKLLSNCQTNHSTVGHFSRKSKIQFELLRTDLIFNRKRCTHKTK